jgi:hypothetical protein
VDVDAPDRRAAALELGGLGDVGRGARARRPLGGAGGGGTEQQDEADVREQSARGPQGTSTVEPVVRRASRSAWARAASTSG